MATGAEGAMTWYEEIVEARVTRPGLANEVACHRRQRRFLSEDKRLFVVAADFAGRGIIAAGDDPLALARRGVMIDRLAEALSVPEVDGVLATADVLDDLLYLEGLRLERGLPSLLDGRLLIGSVNRGGTLGTAFELDDTDTGHSICGALERRLDATKVMIRLAAEDLGSGRTLARAAEVVRESAERRLPVIVEIFPVRRDGTRWATVADSTELARMVVIASALGDNSTYTWLKIPYCTHFEIVAAATSCPITILGGDSSAGGDIASVVIDALAAGPNVRGAVVGRRSLFPVSGTVAEACGSVGRVIHPARVGSTQ